MTKTTISKQELFREYGAVSDLGTLLKKLEHKFLLDGEVVCQFRLNGMSLTEEDEKRLSQINLDEVETIEIESQSPQVLLFSLLANWTRELPSLIVNAEELAKEIKFNGIDGHLKSFVDLLDSCQFLTESLISLESIIKSSTIDQNEWAKSEELTARAIGEALKTFEKKDFVLLSEILEYDLCHALQGWFDQIQLLDQVLKEENARDAKGFSERIFNKGNG